MQAMVDRLNEAGYTMSFEEVEAIAQGGQLGRPHLARAMVDRGYVPTVQAAFDDWLARWWSDQCEPLCPPSRTQSTWCAHTME